MSILSITKTDFVGEITLSKSATNYKLDDSIDIYETEILKKLLGSDLYEDFKTGLEETTILDKWTDLRDGKDFTPDNYDFNISFGGLKNMTLYYIYSKHILNDLENSPFGSGEVDSKNVSHVARQRIKNKSNKIYAEFLNRYKIAQKFIRTNISDYPDFVTTIL